MKIIHFAMFVLSPTVRTYLFKKGVDPDTVYLNDLKFMSKIFNILVSLNILFYNFIYRLTF